MDNNTDRENIVYVDWDYNLATKYCCVKIVSSAKLKASKKAILVPSHQFIQMAP